MFILYCNFIGSVVQTDKNTVNEQTDGNLNFLTMLFNLFLITL